MIVEVNMHKYNNIHHRTIKIKPTDVKSNSYTEYNVDSNEKDPKFGDHVRTSKYKNIFAKGYAPNWPEEVFVISKIKDRVPWSHVNSYMLISYISNEKAMLTLLIVGLVKKTLYKMNQRFPKPYRNFGGIVKVVLDLSSYATKGEFKNAARVDTFKLAAKSDLVSLKAEIDKIDVYKLKTVLVDLSKLSNVLENEVVKKIVYDKLAAKVNNIDTS